MSEDDDDIPLALTSTKYKTSQISYTDEDLAIITTRHYVGTPGAKERVTARCGPFQATTLWLPQFPPFQNHQRAVFLLTNKNPRLRGGKWLALPRTSHSWVFINPGVAREVRVHPFD